MTDGGEELSPPERLRGDHDLSHFTSGNPALDEWLRRRALANDATGASRTYVACVGTRVVGYYSLAAGGVAQAETTGRIRRNMPDPVPVIVLGRLAVDRSVQGRGVGRALLRDAVRRILHAAEVAGIRAILVHAISEEAKRFYEAHGFQASPIAPMTLMITLADAQRALGSA